MHAIRQIYRHTKNLLIMPILLKQNCNMFKQNMGTYWPGNTKLFVSKFNEDYTYRYLSGNCGKQPLSRIEPYKQKFSKCLENYDKPKKKSRRHLFKFKKSPPIKEKPTSCHKMEPIKIKPWKCSCTCPLTYQRQMMMCQKDPRLSDPCYQSTPGDVLIYTEIINTKKLECKEPQPRLTPPYKVSRAALCKMIVADTEKTSCQCITALFKNHNDCTSSKFKINSLPFQEMRPSDKKKKPFTCKDGISTKDVVYPPNTANNFHIKNMNYD